MKQKILDLSGTGPNGDGFGIFLLVGGIILAVAFFGYMLYDGYRMGKRARQMRGRTK